MSILGRGFTLTTLAHYVDGLEKRIALLESAIARADNGVGPAMLSSLSPAAGPSVVNRGRWWYVLNETGDQINATGFKTREEAEALLAPPLASLLASMSEAKAKAA